MSVISWPWDSALSADEYGNPVYDHAFSSNVIATIRGKHYTNGIILDPTTSGQVLASSGLSVSVQPGAGVIEGRDFYSETAETLTHDAASALYDRIDAVVARLNAAPSALEVTWEIVKGTPAASPVAPALTRNSTVWEIAVAYVTVQQNATEILQSDIVDMREDETVCGVCSLSQPSAATIELNARMVDQLGYGAASGLTATLSEDIDRGGWSYASSQITIAAGVAYLPDGTMCVTPETVLDVPGQPHPYSGDYMLIYIASDGTLTLGAGGSTLPLTVPSGGVGLYAVSMETTDGFPILTAYADGIVDMRDYVDGTYIPDSPVVWENPDPTVAYTDTSEQVIDLSMVDFVRIDFNTDPTKSNNTKQSTFLPVQDPVSASAVNIGGFDIYNEIRPVTVTTNGITFGAGKYITTYGSGGTTVSTSACVPIRVVKA